MPGKRLGELLIEKGLLDHGQLQRALAEQPSRRRRIGRVLVDMGMLSEDLVIQVLGEQLQVPVMPLRPDMPTRAALARLEESFCRHNECIPVVYQERNGAKWLEVAVADPANSALLGRIRTRARCSVRAYLAGPRSILAAIDAAYGKAAREDDASVVVGEPIFAFDEDAPAARAPRPAGPPAGDGVAEVRGWSEGQSADWDEPDTGAFDIDVEEPENSGMTGPDHPAVSASDASRERGEQRPAAGSLSQLGPAPAATVASPSLGALQQQIEQLRAHLMQVTSRLDDLVTGLARRGLLDVGPANEPGAGARQAAGTGERDSVSGPLFDDVPKPPAEENAAVIVNTPTREERAVGQRDLARPAAARAGARARLGPSSDGATLDLPDRIAGAAGGRPLVVIDFGTSRSSVAAVMNGRARALPLPGNRWDMPSVVAICDDGSATVGETAREMLPTDPQNTVASPKRLLGRTCDDRTIEPYLANLGVPYSEGSDKQLLLHMRNWDYTIAEICSFVLKTLRIVCERHVEQPVKDAVFTTPVDFTDQQKQELINAAKLAGLEIAELIEEPVAAAMSNYGSPTFDGLVAVYDFGGGTFDFAVVDVSSERVSVVTKGGDSWLGGDDFDDAIASEAANWFWREHQIELRKQVVQWQRLLAVAEATKRQLTRQTQATMVLRDVALTTRGKLSLDYMVSRALFKNSPAVDLIHRSFDACRAALEQAGLRTTDLSAVYLSGGTSYIPAVRDAVERFFGRRPETKVSPDRAVLLGAALFAAMKRVGA